MRPPPPDLRTGLPSLLASPSGGMVWSRRQGALTRSRVEALGPPRRIDAPGDEPGVNLGRGSREGPRVVNIPSVASAQGRPPHPRPEPAGRGEGSSRPWRPSRRPPLAP
jgi:hypothetical protein